MSDFTPQTRQERIDFWAKQAWLCCKDGRADLAELCLDELSSVVAESDRSIADMLTEAAP